MLSLDEMIAQHLMDPGSDPFAAHGLDSATLHLRHDHKTLSDGLGNALSQSYAFNAAAVLLLEPAAQSIRRDPMGLRARFESRQQAIESALSLLTFTKQQQVPATISIGWGRTVLLPENDWISAECYRARRLAELGNQHEITMTQAVSVQLVLPDGVGIFEAKREQSIRIGFPFWIMRDYR